MKAYPFVCRGTIETLPSEVQETKEKTFDDLVESMEKSDGGSEVRDLLSDPTCQEDEPTGRCGVIGTLSISASAKRT